MCYTDLANMVASKCDPNNPSNCLINNKNKTSTSEIKMHQTEWKMKSVGDDFADRPFCPIVAADGLCENWLSYMSQFDRLRIVLLYSPSQAKYD